VKQVAAGYAVYCPSNAARAHRRRRRLPAFTLDREPGAWMLTADRMRISRKHARIRDQRIERASPGAPPVMRYNRRAARRQRTARAASISTCAGSRRWSTDVHRIMTRGGIFLYPRDKPRSLEARQAERLLYEANPMSFLVEQAGGAATNGLQRITEIVPAKLHERVAVILGSKEEVERVTAYHRG